ncbi:MAG: nuclear transport factor 2 family protein [Vicinamibacterales bacterium]
MNQSTPSLTPEIDALKAMYIALNGNDIPGVVSLHAPDFEWIEPSDFPGGKSRYGRAEFEAHLRKMRGMWAEGTCEPERFIPAGDKVVVFVHVHVRLENETAFREGDMADVYTFRDGKATHGQVFTDRNEALRWAGVENPPASE